MSPYEPEVDPPDREPALVTASRAGDRAAFGQLVILHQRSVRVCVALRMNNSHEAEDLAQEAFVIAWKRLRDFDPEARFGPWVRGIAINLVRNHWRKHRAQPVGGSAELETLIAARQDGDRGTEDSHQGTLAALGACLGQLDSANRDLVRLRYEEAVSIEALSARLQAQPSTLTMRLHRLRALLRSCIERKLSAGTP
jgi:RNA polymerase sigma-70 factor (ECF subfamily)